MFLLGKRARANAFFSSLCVQVGVQFALEQILDIKLVSCSFKSEILIYLALFGQMNDEIQPMPGGGCWSYAINEQLNYKYSGNFLV